MADAERTYTEDEVRRLVQAGALANSVMEEDVELTELVPDVANGAFVFTFNNGVTLTVPASGIEQTVVT